MPFIYGFIIAYLLSFPYNFFYDKCFHKIGQKRPKLTKLRNTLALICSYIIGFGIIAFLVCILVPELSKSVSNLINDIPIYAEKAQKAIQDFIILIRDQFGYDLTDADTSDKIVSFITGKDTQEFIENFINNAFPVALNFAEGFTTGLYNWIIGIVVSIYMLASKDKLCKQARTVTVAYLPLKVSKWILKVTTLCNKKCGRFIIGKIIDSFIIGVICFIGLSIFRFDYALLISVVVGVTNVIPFFGPFIGAIPCAFLLLLIDPRQCFWFVVFVIALQQFDGNILGPKILGDTVGVSGFWILFSVLVGGGLFGLPGMLLGVPVFAVIYTLITEGTKTRLQKKRSAQAIIDISDELYELETDITEQCNTAEEINSSDENINENKEEE